MSLKAEQIISLLDGFAPPGLQEEWDNSGLQVGNRRWPVGKVLLAVDVTPAVVTYAVDGHYDFILAHHPLIFHQLKQVDAGTSLGQSIANALVNKICIYAMHTNLDVVQGGVADALAQVLNLQALQVLAKSSSDPRVGLGRIGRLSAPQPLSAFAAFVGNKLGCKALRMCGPGDQVIKLVAVCGGSGDELIKEARRQGADVLVTGDVGHHEALQARELGLALIDPGHYRSEFPILAVLKGVLKSKLPALAITVFPGDGEPMETLVLQEKRGKPTSHELS